MFIVNYEIKNGIWVQTLPGFLANIFAYPMLVYAVILIVVIMFRPKGIFGTYEFSLLNFPRDFRRNQAVRALRRADQKGGKANGQV